MTERKGSAEPIPKTLADIIPFDRSADGWGHVWSVDNLQVYGNRRRGWIVARRSGQVLAHYGAAGDEPGLDALGALARYRRSQESAQPIPTERITEQ